MSSESCLSERVATGQVSATAKYKGMIISIFSHSSLPNPEQNGKNMFYLI
jgi:hypothetical protein